MHQHEQILVQNISLYQEVRKLPDFDKISFTPMPEGSIAAVLMRHSDAAASLVAAMVQV